MMFETISFKQKSGNRNKYHLIFDKGTIDSILCGLNGEIKAKRIINESIYNLLKLNGNYLLISHNPNRYKLFIKSKWAINRTKIEIPYFDKSLFSQNNNNMSKLNYNYFKLLTNDVKKYLRENNKVLVNYLPTQQIYQSQEILYQISLEQQQLRQK